MYRGVSATNCSRDEREQFESRVHLQSLEQDMLSNKEWLAFFHNIKNKQQLLNSFVTYLCTDDFVKSIPLPTLTNSENKIFKVSSSVTKVFEYNHKEDDTRTIFHGLLQKSNLVVCSKDTDVLVLMVFAYTLNKINEM